MLTPLLTTIYIFTAHISFFFVVFFEWFGINCFLHFHYILSSLAPPAASEVKEGDWLCNLWKIKADWWNCGASSRVFAAPRNTMPGTFYCPCVSMWHLPENLLDSKLGHSSHVAPLAVGHCRVIF